MVPRSPYPGDDLATAIRWALDQEGHLFAAGEMVVLRRVRALAPDPMELFARLSLRVGLAFRLPDYECATPQAIDALDEAELLTRAIPPAWALACFSADELRDHCRELGLPNRGPRAELEARLAGHAWLREPILLVGHRELLDRVTRLGGFDRRLAPAERIHGLRWAEYAPTGGPGLYPDRRRLREHERARRGELGDDEALEIARRGPPPWGPSAFARAREQVIATRPVADVLASVPGAALATVRALEAEGRLAEAVTRCRAGHSDPDVALALARTGHRLARRARLPWPPVPPLREATTRRFRLQRAGSGARPLWASPAGAVTVEAAVVAQVEASGRRCVHAENWFWSSCFALVFRELYWLPVPGRLPTARRPGPLDLGTPAFYAARQDAAEAALERLRVGGLAPFAKSYGGEILAGLVHRELAVELGVQLPGDLLASVLSELLRRGFDAARGLPDLLVLGGKAASVPLAFPSTLPERAFLAEVKGPGDTLRDGQRTWIDKLVNGEIHVELWEVSE